MLAFPFTVQSQFKYTKRIGQLQVGTNKNSNLLKIYYLQHKTDERSLHPGHACVGGNRTRPPCQRIERKKFSRPPCIAGKKKTARLIGDATVASMHCSKKKTARLIGEKLPPLKNLSTATLTQAHQNGGSKVVTTEMADVAFDIASPSVIGVSSSSASAAQPQIFMPRSVPIKTGNRAKNGIVKPLYFNFTTEF
jgi:hypothetical protein